MGRRGGFTTSQRSVERGCDFAHQVSTVVYGEKNTLEGDFAVWTSGDRKEFLGQSGSYRGEEYVFQCQFVGFGLEMDGRVGKVSQSKEPFDVEVG